MPEELLIRFFYLIFIGLGVPMLTIALSGLSISFFQAITQIQEQSITYLVKIIAGVCSVALIFPWWKDSLSKFIQQSFLFLQNV